MASILEKLMDLLKYKKQIKESIIQKGQNLSGVALSGYAEKIRNIHSDATVTANDVLDTATFYPASGNLTFGKIGTIEQPDPQLSREDSVIYASYLQISGFVKNQTIREASLDLKLSQPNLISSNIKAGVTMFGVQGTAKQNINIYKCAYVNDGTLGIIVTNAGNYTTNGLYKLISGQLDNRVWFNGKYYITKTLNRYWIISQSSAIKESFDTSIYYINSENQVNPWDSSWNIKNGSSPAPILSYQISSNVQWGGFLWNKTLQMFESTLTSGLVFDENQPKINKCYYEDGKPIANDSYDATADASSILSGYTAYSNGEKITGTASTENAVAGRFLPIQGNLWFVPETGEERYVVSQLYIPDLSGDQPKYMRGIDTSDGTINAETILSGYIGYAQENKYQGKIATLQLSEPTITQNGVTISASYKIDKGYVSGSIEKTAILILSSAILNPPQFNIQGKTISAFYDPTIGYIQSSTRRISEKTLTNEQIQLMDSNLAPGNIASGVTIFGITGKHEGGIDTSDGTINADTVLNGYIGYANKNRYIGNIQTLQLSNPEIVQNGATVSAMYSVNKGYVSENTIKTNIINLETVQQPIPSISTDGQNIIAEYIPTTGFVIDTSKKSNSLLASDIESHLKSQNIKSGTSIFGVSGKSSVVDTQITLNPVTSNKILSGYVGFANGNQILGTSLAENTTAGQFIKKGNELWFIPISGGNGQCVSALYMPAISGNPS